jgi:hypothetical protein
MGALDEDLKPMQRRGVPLTGIFCSGSAGTSLGLLLFPGTRYDQSEVIQSDPSSTSFVRPTRPFACRVHELGLRVGVRAVHKMPSCHERLPSIFGLDESPAEYSADYAVHRPADRADWTADTM